MLFQRERVTRLSLTKVLNSQLTTRVKNPDVTAGQVLVHGAVYESLLVGCTAAFENSCRRCYQIRVKKGVNKMAGLANLSEFFENPLFTETIREVPVETGYIGSRFLPSENTYDMEWNETVIERQADMADLVDAGAELPLTDRDPVRRVSGSIADMGQSYILTKKELAAMSDKGNEGRRKMAVQQVLKKTAQLKSNIDARVEWLRWQALGNGAMIYDKSGIKLGVDFGCTRSQQGNRCYSVGGVTVPLSWQTMSAGYRIISTETTTATRRTYSLPVSKISVSY